MNLNPLPTTDYRAPSAIHPAARLGPVSYTTPDLARQVDFYTSILGFSLRRQEGGQAWLGAGERNLLHLVERPGAQRPRRTTGLYHTAFLVPTRWELANLLRRIAETRTPIQGMSDHGTHHAIYLPDADGNGIELAWDRPPSEWPRSMPEMMRRNRALDPAEVFSALDDRAWSALDPATRVGHVHLHVADLPATDRFYRQALGMDIPLEMVMDTAIFFSAGGYHHHVGANIWQGAGAPPPPPDSTGLRHFSLILPTSAELEIVADRLAQAGFALEPVEGGLLTHDPAQNGLMLSVEKKSKHELAEKRE